MTECEDIFEMLDQAHDFDFNIVKDILVFLFYEQIIQNEKNPAFLID